MDWNTTAEEIEKLISLLLETSIPDRTLAICYATSRARDIGHATYLIQRNRVENQTSFAGIEQTPEETTADISFVNLR